MTEPNIELLNKTLAHIETHPDGWEQQMWITLPEERAPGCGTAYCFAGWAVTLSGFSIDEHGYVSADQLPPGILHLLGSVGRIHDFGFRDGVNRADVPDVASELLGIGGNFWTSPAPHLFDGSNTLEDLRRHVAELCGETVKAGV